jgi:hypothetical protein
MNSKSRTSSKVTTRVASDMVAALDAIRPEDGPTVHVVYTQPRQPIIMPRAQRAMIKRMQRQHELRRVAGEQAFHEYVAEHHEAFDYWECSA